MDDRSSEDARSSTLAWALVLLTGALGAACESGLPSEVAAGAAGAQHDPGSAGQRAGQASSGGVAGTAGAAPGGAVSTGGLAAPGGAVSTGGLAAPGGAVSTGGLAGQGGAAGCSDGDTRCTGLGRRQRCADDQWEDDACPLDRPACESGTCVLRGPTMVEIWSLDTTSYYIDSTEVTVGQYREFLDARADDTNGQREECAFNTSYRPAAGESVLSDDFPMAYVDWCDAAAFCAWAGKRLCGKIGGGSLLAEDLTSDGTSQWYAACGYWLPSLDGSGDPEVPCVLRASAPVPVGTSCEGSYPGLFEMVGNVAEWQDSCTGTSGAEDVCYLQGSVWSHSGYCYTVSDYPRSTRAPTFGFRCCSG